LNGGIVLGLLLFSSVFLVKFSFIFEFIYKMSCKYIYPNMKYNNIIWGILVMLLSIKSYAESNIFSNGIRYTSAEIILFMLVIFLTNVFVVFVKYLYEYIGKQLKS
jgi:hypothetical protein